MAASTSTESSLGKLATALVAFQKIVPVIEKRQTATIPMKSGGSYSYKYADLSDIWSAIRQPLADSGLAVTQGLQGGSDGYTTIKTKVWHESGETSESLLDVPTQSKTPQEAGSLFTYYKRYALGAELGISTEEDDDAQSSNTAPAAPPRASSTKPASDKQKSMIAALAHKVGKDNEWIDNVMTKTVSSADASAVIEKLQALEKDGDMNQERTWR
jgi:hypothetical protein